MFLLCLDLCPVSMSPNNIVICVELEKTTLFFDSTKSLMGLSFLPAYSTGTRPFLPDMPAQHLLGIVIILDAVGNMSQ